MLNMLIRWKSSISGEIISHFRLLSTKKENVLSYLSSPYRIVLCILFTVLFLPHVFVIVSEDINFVIAYEVDPGSVIQSILSLYQHHYNMNAAYHSQFYGWAYYVINFILLAPVYIVTALKIIPNNYYVFISIRFILFMLGLASVLAFFEVAKRILKHNFLSFVAALLYIASPVIFKFFYFLHPETTGLLFLFISVLCLITYNEGKAEDYRWYTFGLFSLVLSILSKQVFVFTAPFVFFLYIYFYCHHRQMPFLRFLTSKQFARVLFASAVFSILIFFIINPFAFLQPKIFIGNQIILFSGQVGGGSLTRSEALKAWIEVIKTIPIMSISLISFPFTILGAVILGRNQNAGKALDDGKAVSGKTKNLRGKTSTRHLPFNRYMPYIVNILGAVFFVLILTTSARLIIQSTYFAPIYPFFLLNLISIPLYIVRKWNVTIIKFLVMIPLSYFLFFILVGDFSVSIPESYTRLMYKDTTMYRVYNYIEEKIPGGSKIAYDHHIALPSNKDFIGCHFWQGCGTDYIEEFQPDYVIFDENWTFNGVHPPTVQLTKYVNDHHFLLIDTIDAISVWKKPDQ